MAFTFSEDDFERIAAVLGGDLRRNGATTRIKLVDEESGRRLELEIVTDLHLPQAISDEPTNLVSVYGNQNAFLQLQDCTGYIASDELGEVIFFAKRSGMTNGLVVERVAGCTLYANVDDRLLSTDFTELPPAMLMSIVALSLTDELLGGLK